MVDFNLSRFRILGGHQGLVSHPHSSIPPSLHPSPQCLYLIFLSIQAQNGATCIGRKTGKHPRQVSSLSQTKTLSHSYSHMSKSQRLQSAWPARLWTAGGNWSTLRKSLVKSSQVKFICTAQYHIKCLNGLYRLTTATVSGPVQAL